MVPAIEIDPSSSQPTVPVGLGPSLPGPGAKTTPAGNFGDKLGEFGRWGIEQGKGAIDEKTQQYKEKLDKAKKSAKWAGSIAKNLWNDPKSGAKKLGKDATSLVEKGVDKGADTVTGLYNEIHRDATKSALDFSKKWDRGEKFGAALGLGGDVGRFALWDSPFSLGRGMVGKEAREHFANGEWGRGAVNVNDNIRDQATFALSLAVPGPKFLRLPKIPKPFKAPKGGKSKPDSDTRNLADGDKGGKGHKQKEKDKNNGGQAGRLIQGVA